MAKSDNQGNLSLIISVIALIGVGAVFLGANQGAPHTIAVSASGVAYGYPDQATIYMSMNGTGQTPAAANSNLSQTTSAVAIALGPYVNNNQSLIQTQSYNIYKGRFLVCTNVTKGPTINLPAPFSCSLEFANSSSLYCCYNQTAYVATQSVMVTIPNINNVSAAFTAISNIPNVYSQSLSQSLSEKQNAMLMNNSLSSALANATAQAQLLAGSRGTVVVQNITVYNSPVYYPAYFANAAHAGAQPSSFFAGRVGVTRSVNVVFRIG